jgi:hypothetical protein
MILLELLMEWTKENRIREQYSQDSVAASQGPVKPSNSKYFSYAFSEAIKVPCCNFVYFITGNLIIS